MPEGYYDDYYVNLVQYLTDNGGVLSARKYTEYSRVILALTALGRNPADVAGHNLLMPLSDYDAAVAQGISGPVFALLALDSGAYDMPLNPSAPVQATRALYVEKILSYQTERGGFSATGASSSGIPDVDITAMALCALAKYQDIPKVKTAVDKAVGALSSIQYANGGFGNPADQTAEGTAQVILALCELQIPIDDMRFTKSRHTPLDALLTFALPGGGFAHTLGGGIDEMATEQALCALASLARVQSGGASFYDMTDIRNATFPDTAGYSNQPAIEVLASLGIINGMGDGTFKPFKTVTRAEFAAMIVRALGLSQTDVTVFGDVQPGAWYADYVGAAYSSGIILGTSGTAFSPGAEISVREAEIMLSRAAVIVGIGLDIPDWSADADLLTRGEAAQEIFDMLARAGIIR